MHLEPAMMRRPLDTLGTPESGTRAHAEETAEKFEALFVRQLVSSLRQSATFGQEGGMFGSGSGADTYAGWFDQHVAEQLGQDSTIGIKEVILRDMERHKQLAPERDQQAALATAQRAADRAGFRALPLNRSTIDVID